MSDTAEENDANLVVFAGGSLNGPDTSTIRNSIYNLINPEMFDGVILTPSLLLRYSSEEEAKKLLQPLSHLPMVCIGSQWEDCPVIKPDVESGMYKVLVHLIETHGCRRIAYINSSGMTEQSNMRFRVYLEVLKKYNLPFDPKLVVPAHLGRMDGFEAVLKLLDQPDCQFDALISFNDLMALGAIEGLDQRGYRVPEDILVVGFNGSPESAFAIPPLTTLNEDAYEQGRQAAAMVISIIQGKSIPMVNKINTELIIRNSCGCSREINLDNFDYSFSYDRPSFEESFNNNRDYLLEVVSSAANVALLNQKCKISVQSLEALLDSYQESFAKYSQEFFLKKIKEITKISPDNNDISAWFNAILLLRSCTFNYLNGERDLQLYEQLWQKSTLLLIDAFEKILIFKEVQRTKTVNLLQEIGIALNSAFDLSRPMNTMFDIIGINYCYIARFEGREAPENWCRLVLAYKDRKKVEINESECRYLSTQLLPEWLIPDDSRYTFLVEPLHYRTETLGYMVMNLGIRDGGVYENIMTQITSALKNDLQINMLREAEKRFSDIAFSTSDWLWEVDAQCRFTYCSDGVFKVLGYTSEEMIGRSLFDFLLHTETEYQSVVCNQLMPDKLPISNLENWNYHKDGHLVGLLISGTPILNEDGALLGYRGVFKDITENKQAEERIKFLAYYDILTGLPNRILFNDRLETAISQARRDKSILALMFLDLDRFKTVNDTLGHAAGDELLKKVAARLKSCIRSNDTLARLGGDEFTILLPRINSTEEVVGIAHRVLKAMNSPFDLKENQIFITTSIGVAVYPNDGADSQAILKNADKAMYRAKEQGKNRFMFLDKDIEIKSIKRMQIESILYNALEKNELIVCYQPLIDCNNGEITGMEALLRLNNSKLGLITPLEFIPIAEDTGLIDPIGNWVLKTACKQISAWHKIGFPNLHIAVNLSARQFRNTKLVEIFANIIKKAGLKPEFVELEITENAVIDNEEIAKSTLFKFKELGVKIALDDFGTGYSSLRFLKRFPINTVKIDKSFVGDCTTDPDSEAIIKAITFMAKSLKLQVVAEGVETREQLSFACSLGCDKVQGYLFSKPLTAEEITKLLREKKRFDL